MHRILVILGGLILSGAPVHGQGSPAPLADRSSLYAMMDSQAPFAPIRLTTVTNHLVAAPAGKAATNAVARSTQTGDTNAPAMNYYDGSWHHTFANDPETRGQGTAVDAGHLENARLDGVVGTIDVGGKSFEVTKGMPDFTEDFAATPDASRAALREEMNRHVEVGGGFYFSQNDKLGYELSKNATISTSGLGKVKLSVALPSSWRQ